MTEKQTNIRKLMLRGKKAVEMIEPLTEIEGKSPSEQSISQRLRRMLESHVVSAQDVRQWRRLIGDKKAEKIIRYYKLV